MHSVGSKHKSLCVLFDARVRLGSAIQSVVDASILVNQTRKRDSHLARARDIAEQWGCRGCGECCSVHLRPLFAFLLCRSEVTVPSTKHKTDQSWLLSESAVFMNADVAHKSSRVELPEPKCHPHRLGKRREHRDRTPTLTELLEKVRPIQSENHVKLLISHTS
jgi:hypothetical protein